MKHNLLKEIVAAQKEGRQIGIYSACSANLMVLKAVLRRGAKDHAPVLIEATANQCDQFGGYTGMTPTDFKDLVIHLADEAGLEREKLFLGGDHLGPLTFAGKPEEEAMQLAEDLVRTYVLAGFTKIHLDTSMKVASDPDDVPLSDEIIARRGARLMRTAQMAYQELVENNPEAGRPVFVVGSEVPTPGGPEDDSDELRVTSVEDFRKSEAMFEKVFHEEGLDHAWKDVIAFVVQPGVEESDSGCVEYDHEKAKELCTVIKEYPQLIFEGHSTDYQTAEKLREMVKDGIGILKVGPALSFAMREGAFALSYIEDELITPKERSDLRGVLDREMLDNPRYWERYYTGTSNEIALKRRFSFSDRCRYYFSSPRVNDAIEKMMDNLKNGIPLSLLSQFMPVQYRKVRQGLIDNTPEELILDRIDNTIDEYMFATRQDEL